jgi:hypothetical protein
MYREKVFRFLVVVIGLCESLDLNILGCVKDCNDEVFISLFWCIINISWEDDGERARYMIAIDILYLLFNLSLKKTRQMLTIVLYLLQLTTNVMLYNNTAGKIVFQHDKQYKDLLVQLNMPFLRTRPKGMTPKNKAQIIVYLLFDGL